MSLWAVFVASLLGSLHCAGMCGAFAALTASGERPVARTLSYHAGRALTYGALGALAGGLGWSAERLVGALGPARAVAPLIVAAPLLLGAAWLLWAPEAGGRGPRGPLSELLVALQRRALKLGRAGGPLGALALGASSTLLPCGWLWSAVLMAGASGGAGGGLSMMLVFWLGSVPALLGVGALARRMSAEARAWGPRLGALTLIAAAAWTLAQRWPSSSSAECCQRPAPLIHAPEHHLDPHAPTQPLP